MSACPPLAQHQKEQLHMTADGWRRHYGLLSLRQAGGVSLQVLPLYLPISFAVQQSLLLILCIRPSCPACVCAHMQQAAVGLFWVAHFPAGGCRRSVHPSTFSSVSVAALDYRRPLGIKELPKRRQQPRIRMQQPRRLRALHRGGQSPSTALRAYLFPTIDPCMCAHE